MISSHTNFKPIAHNANAFHYYCFKRKIRTI